jgi:transcriptional regulator with XRE-family HTH domain
MGQKVSERIRKIRVIKGLTQENVAEEMGISHGAYAKIERGETDPNTSRLHDIASVLKVNVTDFFDDNLSAVTEYKNPYGYASKDEVENLTKLVVNLTKEIEKLRSEITPKKRGAKKSK